MLTGVGVKYGKDSHPLPYPEAALVNPFAAFAFTVIAFANPIAAIWLAIVANRLAVATKWLAIVGNGLAKASFWFAYPVFIDILALFVILNARPCENSRPAGRWKVGRVEVL